MSHGTDVPKRNAASRTERVEPIHSFEPMGGAKNDYWLKERECIDSIYNGRDSGCVFPSVAIVAGLTRGSLLDVGRV